MSINSCLAGRFFHYGKTNWHWYYYSYYSPVCRRYNVTAYGTFIKSLYVTVITILLSLFRLKHFKWMVRWTDRASSPLLSKHVASHFTMGTRRLQVALLSVSQAAGPGPAPPRDEPGVHQLSRRRDGMLLKPAPQGTKKELALVCNHWLPRGTGRNIKPSECCSTG